MKFRITVFILLPLVLSAILIACSDQETSGTAADAQSDPAPAVMQSARVEGDMELGQQVFKQWCLPCHGAGPGHAGTMALAARLGEENSVLLERGDLPPEYIKYVIRNGFQMMPPFRITEIPDREMEAVAAYVSSNGGNGNGGKGN